MFFVLGLFYIQVFYVDFDTLFSINCSTTIIVFPSENDDNNPLYI